MSKHTPGPGSSFFPELFGRSLSSAGSVGLCRAQPHDYDGLSAPPAAGSSVGVRAKPSHSPCLPAALALGLCFTLHLSAGGFS